MWAALQVSAKRAATDRQMTLPTPTRGHTRTPYTALRCLCYRAFPHMLACAAVEMSASSHIAVDNIHTHMHTHALRRRRILVHRRVQHGCHPSLDRFRSMAQQWAQQKICGERINCHILSSSVSLRIADKDGLFGSACTPNPLVL